MEAWKETLGYSLGLERTRNAATDKHYLGGPQQLVVNHSYYQWPNGVVPYQFDSSVSSKQIDLHDGTLICFGDMATFQNSQISLLGHGL